MSYYVSAWTPAPEAASLVVWHLVSARLLCSQVPGHPDRCLGLELTFRLGGERLSVALCSCELERLARATANAWEMKSALDLGLVDYEAAALGLGLVQPRKGIA